MVVIKKWIGHGSEEMVNRYTHLRPNFMQNELERLADFAPKFGTKNAKFDPIDPGQWLRHDGKDSVRNTSGIV